MSDNWMDILLSGSYADFDTEKNVQLMERIVGWITKDTDIILDSFAGSGTTAHAVLNMNKADGGNRKFILVEMMDYAETITAEWVRRVTDGYAKDMLIEVGIPKEEIAIKTSKINELKNMELMSRDCPIKYIITVNALKEGWDCPFAYILASLANKTSAVDVERILGRILRQPYTKQHNAPILNTSYVLTCSNDFRDTLDRIVVGLNKAGFSKKDFRVGEAPEAPVQPAKTPVQTDMFGQVDGEKDRFEDIAPEDIRAVLEQGGETPPPFISAMVAEAAKQSEEYDSVAAGTENNGFLGGELGAMMNQFQMQAPFAAEAAALKIPQFFIRTAPGMFGWDKALLTKEALSGEFSLRGQDAQVDFGLDMGGMY